MKHALILSELLGMPWALMPDRLSVIASVIVRWALEREASPEVMAQIATDVEAREARRAAAAEASQGGIAVLPFYGVTTQRPVQNVSGPGTVSTQMFGATLQQAVKDASIGGIVIDMDSPGGSAFGVVELASQVRDARSVKPVYAVANPLSASAAYWIGSQASAMFAAPASLTGNIGVYTAHRDVSKALEAEGEKVTLISAGKYKVEGNSLEPLSDEARAHIQSQVDDIYGMFTRDVATGRGVPVAAVRDGYGEGRALLPAPAKAAGLIDDIATLDQVIARMQRTIQGNSPSRVARARRELDIIG